MDNKKIDDIVSLLDGFVENGGGHMDIEVKDNDVRVTKRQIKTTNSLECANKRNMACSVPTLHEGLDCD